MVHKNMKDQRDFFFLNLAIISITGCCCSMDGFISMICFISRGFTDIPCSSWMIASFDLPDANKNRLL